MCGDGKINAQDGDTVLTLAASKGHTDCVRLLLEGGADKEAKNSVRVIATSIFVACLSISVDYLHT